MAIRGLHIAGHPIHPALVHFPIALWTFAIVADLAGAAGMQVNPGLGYTALVAGLVMAGLALLAGFVEYALVEFTPPARRAATLHMVMMSAAATLFFVSAWLRGGPIPPSGAALGAAIGGWIVLAIGGWLGGTLVYRYGVGVGTPSG